MALETYRKKRKFKVTPEPRGHRGPRGGNRYVIQKHAGRRLHYDLRLELDGVMKSWAVTRGPSLDPEQKRLAVQVEDHPVEYNTFEGTIPEGEYGGGTVLIWDRGRWFPDGDPHKGLAKGHLQFTIEGEKLHGRWHLVRMRSRPNDRHPNWLLIKGKDDDARSLHDKDILNQKPLSVASGRSIEEVAQGKGRKRIWHSNRATEQSALQKKGTNREKRGAARSKPATLKSAQKKSSRSAAVRLPKFIPPSLAMLHDHPPHGSAWLHEIKFDGYRIEARLDHGSVRLLTRNQQDWTDRYEPVAAAVAALPAQTALLDGELVVEDEQGVSSFSLLQSDLKSGRTDRLAYCVFDLLHLDGRDLTSAPLVDRKAALEGLIGSAKANRHLRYTQHFDEDGEVIFRHACGMGLEGVVSKLRDAPYRSGRSDNFIKCKCRNAQEFVVAGFSPSTAQRAAVGALTVAVNTSDGLRYAGRIGTGYTRKTARELYQRLDKLRTNRPPVELPPDERRKDVIWVKPQVVVEAEFRGWTHGDLVRQAAFKGLREDKPAREVVRETAAPTTPAAIMAQQQAVRKSTKKADPPARGMAKTAARSASSRPTPAKAHGDWAEIKLTHPDRVYWADVGVTKEDLAEYYVGVWKWMAPHIVGRPLALLRCPEGIQGQCFFQKHIAANVKESPLRHKVDAKEHDVIALEKLADLIALVQSGALEIHVRGSRLDRLEYCDRLVFDLDPGDGVTWREVVAAAREVRERLDAAKLKSFVKLSGGKGVHVVVPIVATDWERAKTFTQRLALSMAADNPNRYLAKMTKALRHGRIFIDYLRNTRESTAVAPYSTRARPGAAVSAPLLWTELGRTKSSAEFTLLNLRRRRTHDAWADIGRVKQRLPPKL